MKSNFKPYEYVLNLNFGETSYEIAEKLNIKPSKFEREPGCIVDDFNIMHVEYKDKKSISYEIFNNIDIFFENVNLTKNKIDFLTDYFKNLDDKIELDHYGFTSYKYGFAIYGEPEENIVESVMIFKKDYYKGDQ